MKRIGIKIEGKVQGVWYRKSTQEKAIELSLSGFVKNKTEGTVYVEAQGDEKALNFLVSWCHKGPTNAEVRKVQVMDIDLVECDTFEIRN